MRNTLFSAIVCFLALALNAQNSYQPKNFTATDGTTLNYQILTPASIDAGQSYPLVIFMHGAGERGSDNEKQLVHGSRMFENPVNREKYPAYVLFPQCPEDGYWAYPGRPASFSPDSMPILNEPTPLINCVKELLETYSKLPSVDSNRIYIIGISMGGMATYDLTARYPDLFAAAIPICGTVNPQRMKNAANINFRIFHGDADNVVPVEGSREAYKALSNAGAEVEYIEMPGTNHGSWNPAFNFPDFMSWLFSQNKKEENNIPSLD